MPFKSDYSTTTELASDILAMYDLSGRNVIQRREVQLMLAIENKHGWKMLDNDGADRYIRRDRLVGCGSCAVRATRNMVTWAMKQGNQVLPGTLSEAKEAKKLPKRIAQNG